jgi:antitoxin StbD
MENKMESVFARRSASISELKKNPSSLIEQSGGEPIAILNHNKPTAYLIPAETYELMIEQIEDYHLGLIVKERQGEKSSAIEVDLDDL